MQDLQSYLDTKLEADDEFVVPPHKSPEDLLDQFGVMASVMMQSIRPLAFSIISIPRDLRYRIKLRKYLRDDSVSIAFIAACTSHHIPLGYSSTLMDLRAELKWLAAKKASFNMLGIWHRHLVRLCRYDSMAAR
jgi:hypothetical protein